MSAPRQRLRATATPGVFEVVPDGDGDSMLSQPPARVELDNPIIEPAAANRNEYDSKVPPTDFNEYIPRPRSFRDFRSQAPRPTVASGVDYDFFA